MRSINSFRHELELRYEFTVKICVPYSLPPWYHVLKLAFLGISIHFHQKKKHSYSFRSNQLEKRFSLHQQKWKSNKKMRFDCGPSSIPIWCINDRSCDLQAPIWIWLLIVSVLIQAANVSCFCSVCKYCYANNESNEPNETKATTIKKAQRPKLHSDITKKRKYARNNNTAQGWKSFSRPFHWVKATNKQLSTWKKWTKRNIVSSHAKCTQLMCVIKRGQISYMSICSGPSLSVNKIASFEHGVYAVNCCGNRATFGTIIWRMLHMKTFWGIIFLQLFSYCERKMYARKRKKMKLK